MTRDAVLTPKAAQTVELARTFARQYVAPNAALWEVERRLPLETLKAACETGLAGLRVPKAMGGLDLDYRASFRVMEALAEDCMAFAFGLAVQNNISVTLAESGETALTERLLPRVLTGERIGAFCLTEPSAGSDATAITTSARREDEAWIIDGEKAWVSNGTAADLLLVYAQTDPSLGWRGIAGFLVEAETPGIEREAAYGLMGGHAIGINGFRFQDCRVPAEAMILPPEAAFKHAMRHIDAARANVAAMCCGMMGAGLECALDYAMERQAFGQATAEFQALQWLLADVETDLEAGRLLVDRAAAALDAGSRAISPCAHAKKFATRAALRRLADCIQVMGAAGCRSDVPLGRHLAMAKMAQIVDGTTEIQNLVIARDLIRGRRDRNA